MTVTYCLIITNYALKMKSSLCVLFLVCLNPLRRGCEVDALGIDCIFSNADNMLGGMLLGSSLVFSCLL